MLFNSYAFIFAFLPVCLAGYWLLARAVGGRMALGWLTAASFFFYGYWNPAYVGLLVASLVANYVLAGALVTRKLGPGAQRALTTLGVVGNLGLLGYYKYSGFFLETVGYFMDVGDIASLVLPLGISFYTFEQIAYLVDVYKGKGKRYGFLDYIFFVSFFPHLLAGPIVVHREILEQVEGGAPFRFSLPNFAGGATLFIIGLFKKVVIADNVSMHATPLFDAVAAGAVPGFFSAWLAVFAYSLQLYFDFSGYSDMAIGLGLLFNVKLPVNFDSPYKAASVIDFWRRWHMTLSRFLREYLYVPLGGSRKGPARRHVNLMITMLLGGLWHGAGWGFVIWGGLNGVFLVINHGWRKLRGDARKRDGIIAKEAAVTLTFVCIMLSRVFFRSADMTTAMTMFRALAGMTTLDLFEGLVAHKGAVVLCLAVYLLSRYAPNSQELLSGRAPMLGSDAKPAPLAWRFSPAWALAAALLLVASVLSLTEVSEFLYFQF